MKSEAIARLLPAIFQRVIRPETPLSAILDAMEALHATPEAILGDLSATFDPRKTPDRFVPFLARWVDLDWLFEPLVDERRRGTSPTMLVPTGLGRLRELVAAAPLLVHRSGTAQGLLLFLRTATGEQDFSIDENLPDRNGKPRPYHIVVQAPATTAGYRALIQRIIEFEKPAYVTYELEFRPAQ